MELEEINYLYFVFVYRFSNIKSRTEVTKK